MSDAELKLVNHRPRYLLVGAYGGVGLALASRLRASGAVLFLVGRDEEKLSLIADQVDAPYMVADASEFDAMGECVKIMGERLGGIDGAVCVTGSLMLKPAHLTSSTDWSSTLGDNLTAAFSVVRSASRAMMRSGGSIILVSSVAASLGMPNHEAIAAAKAGIDGLVRAAAATYARHNIRVNSVAPGMLATSLTERLASNPELLAKALEMYPISRRGSAEEIAAVIAWLLSEESGWITGQVLRVDGGLSTVRTILGNQSQAVSVSSPIEPSKVL